jgi:hypothetical protein
MIVAGSHWPLRCSPSSAVQVKSLSDHPWSLGGEPVGVGHQDLLAPYTSTSEKAVFMSAMIPSPTV